MRTKQTLKALLSGLPLLLLHAGAPLSVGAPAESATRPGRPDVVFADFEAPTYGDWAATGTAFGDGPAEGTLPHQMDVSGYKGKRLASSYHGGDDATGTLTSPPFKINRRYIGFLIGGGGYAGKTCVNLLVSDNGAGEKVVRTAVGPNTQPGGSEDLEPASWDVDALAGREARIQIVDNATGGWGHISIDHIVFTDAKPPAKPQLLSGVSREITAEHHWLWFPIRSRAPGRMVRVLVDGKAERYFEAELADGEAGWWSPLDVSAWRGKKVTVLVDRLPEDSTALSSLRQTDEWEGAEPLYKEALRPQFHFSARRGWLNDPNGLSYFNGEYHMFFQHSPFSWGGTTKMWGHAVGKDLVHWKELDDEALWADERGAMWSGSAVVDEHNTSGFGAEGKPAQVLIYTAAGDPFTQCIAHSTDGRRYAKYADNPVVPHIVGGDRDPKVIWYEPQKKWVLALYLDGDVYGLFSSPDLKKWEKMSEVRIPGTSECPEFFEISVAGESAAPGVQGGAEGGATETRWVFYGGNGGYLVGKFDGHAFTPEGGRQELQHGNCWYASQTFNNLPAADGRRVLLPWGTIDLPGMPFNQIMGIPVELTLHRTDEGLRLRAEPVRELASLHGAAHARRRQALNPGDNPLADLTGDLFDVTAELSPGGAEEVGFTVRGVPVTYDVRKQELACLGRHAALKLVDGKISLRVLIDRTSIDLFGNAGRLYMPMGTIFPKAEPSGHPLAVWAKGGEARVVSMEVHDMKSAWH